ncbi:MAG: ATP-binding cassette domain-containing protein [Chitinivibrionales bacterium]|nr:ATP-binding cassette domain-containing protein [Chitinivibrionales bacterium]MBD3395665.1 ATP-binding cassette domain-containing protein [Chitinivibrionales bacterium]
MPEPVISVANVSKTYGKDLAVDALSFAVMPRACFGMLGPNGAGKTTMMKMIYGKSIRDRNPESVISVFGYDPQVDELSIKNIAGVVPQEDNLDEELNVIQNLRIYATLYNLRTEIAAARIEGLLEFMELGRKKKTKIKELSGGMKRRLIIARALLNNPRLLILDEPTTGLDPQVRHVIWEKLRGLKRKGMTILLTTHYMEEATQMCDRVLIMDKARRIMEGPPARLVADQIEAYVLELLSPKAHDAVRGLRMPDTVRVDDSTDSMRLYARDIDALEDIRRHLTPGEYSLRQSDLEDVFLNATGRKLHVKQ